ncbi:GNAT family N-acetyltransferase [Catalinimonas sp. 4WD22]|uniref:GNAT family N-acetyltransferase n=1 Tax=Catalinimonas locisalis TaxID=3133978 RepID=UPI003100D564
MSALRIDKQNLQLSLLNPHDLKELQALSIKTFQDAFGSVNTEEDMKIYLEQAFGEAQLLEELQDTDTDFYFLKNGRETVGYCKLKFGLPNTHSGNGKALEICRLYVLQQYQGKQLGQWMLNNIVQMAEERGLDFAWLGVWSQNPGAIRLYERNGFSKIGSYTFMLGNDAQTDYILKRELRDEMS